MAYDGSFSNRTDYGDGSGVVEAPLQTASSSIYLLNLVVVPAYIDILTIEGPLHRELVRIGFNRASADILAEQSAHAVAHEMKAGASLEDAVKEAASRLKTAFDLSASPTEAAKPELALPAQLSPDQIYATRPDKSVDPITFLQSVWKPYMDADVVYQDDIKRLGDDKLVSAIHSYCQRNGLRAKDVLPPPKARRTERVIANADSEALAFLKASRAMRRRKRAAP